MPRKTRAVHGRCAECKKYIRARTRAARIQRYTTRMHVRNIPALERATDMANQPVPHAPRASARAPFERNARGRGGARAAQAARDRGGVWVRVQRCAVHVQRRGAHGALRRTRARAAASGAGEWRLRRRCERRAERLASGRASGRASAHEGAGGASRGGVLVRVQRCAMHVQRRGAHEGAGGSERRRWRVAAAACWCACRGAQCTCRGVERTRARRRTSGAGGAWPRRRVGARAEVRNAHAEARSARGRCGSERRRWRVAAAACWHACRGAQCTCRGAERTRALRRGRMAAAATVRAERSERSGLRAGRRAGGRAGERRGEHRCGYAPLAAPRAARHHAAGCERGA